MYNYWVLTWQGLFSLEKIVSSTHKMGKVMNAAVKLVRWESLMSTIELCLRIAKVTIVGLVIDDESDRLGLRRNRTLLRHCL